MLKPRLKISTKIGNTDVIAKMKKPGRHSRKELLECALRDNITVEELRSVVVELIKYTLKE